MVAVLVIGLLFIVVGSLGIVFREQLDASSMRWSPNWIKPPGGGGVFAPSQRSYRIKSATFGMALLVVFGVGAVVAAIVHG